ncbi:MAG: hypothetical protein ACW99L_14545, partial [Promethearchaeota archaeon]
MVDLKLFVDVNNEISDKMIVCQSNADKLGLKNGDSIEAINTDNNLKKVAILKISNDMLDFAGQFAKNILEELQFSGVELTIRPISTPTASSTPKVKTPKVPTTKTLPTPEKPPGLSPLPTLPPQPTPSTQTMPSPTPTPQPIIQPAPQPIAQPAPTPQLTPTPQPSLSPPPSRPLQAPPEVKQFSATAQPQIEPTIPLDPYPNKIDIDTLQ